MPQNLKFTEFMKMNGTQLNVSCRMASNNGLIDWAVGRHMTILNQHGVIYKILHRGDLGECWSQMRCPQITAIEVLCASNFALL